MVRVYSSEEGPRLKTPMRLIALILLVCFSLCGQQASPRLVIISVDGLMSRTLRNAESLGLRLPNLIEFRDRGTMSEGLVGVFPTVTYPTHTTMVTGRYPADHGIVSNTLFDPERKLYGAWYWYSELIKVPTLWEAANAAGLKTGAVGWPVTAGAAIDFNVPEYRAFRNEDDILLFRSLPTPGLLRAFEKARGAIKLDPGGHHDDLLSDMAAFVIETHKPHLMLVHLIDLDHDQHLHGPESRPALRTLENIDRAIGKLRKAVEHAGLAKDTRWIIVSDHGFFKVEKLFHPEAFLASMGLVGGADAGSWRVAVRNAGGCSAFVLKDPGDEEAKALVLRMLGELKRDGGFGIDRIIERDELQRMHAWPDAFAALSMKEGWAAGSGRTGAWVTVSETTKGTHGYAPGPEALDATFMAFGPGIPARRIARGRMIDVAPTASRLLGLRMSELPGVDLLASPASTKP
ncbi:MAG TPA: ectonucleotide pyrophosphatase/phosphodiesterase [Bryobacteraceae bacterium]|nr:ectonucleotide pyrophosphatase/phosphodiesterase [Bryobacteraceae bacterium]